MALLAMAGADIRVADTAMRQYDEQLDRWEQQYTYTQDAGTRQQLLASRPDARRTTQVVLKAIGAELSRPSSMRAIAWIYENDASFLRDPAFGNAGEAIRNAMNRALYNKPGAGALCLTISQHFSPQDLGFLEKVAKQAPTAEEQGQASLAVSIALSTLGDDPALITKRLQHLRHAIKTIPEDMEINGKKVTDVISDQLYVIQYLSKGRTAPNIEGADSGGQPVSLASAAGQVTALVFWAEEDLQNENWLPIMQGMHKITADTGSRMLGVYTGGTAKLRQLVADREVTWQTAVDQAGSITQQFRISQTPTVFLLDRQGRIQSIGEPNSLINLSIQALAAGE